MDLSQSHKRCDYSLVRTPYAKSILFLESHINLNKHALLHICASNLYMLVGTKLILISTCSLGTKYDELVALKWKYFQIIKWIRN